MSYRGWCPRGDSNSQDPASEAGMSAGFITGAFSKIHFGCVHTRAAGTWPPRVARCTRGATPCTNPPCPSRGFAGGVVRAHPKWSGWRDWPGIHFCSAGRLRPVPRLVLRKLLKSHHRCRWRSAITAVKQKGPDPFGIRASWKRVDEKRGLHVFHSRLMFGLISCCRCFGFYL